MSGYIARDVLLNPDNIIVVQDETGIDESPYTYTNAVKVETILNAPTADVVEVRHGRWEVHGTYKRENILMVGLICSECHFSIAKKVNLDDEETMINNYSYCPNCGAKMDGERRRK